MRFDHYQDCPYQIVVCDKPEHRCRPGDACPTGRVVFRDKYTNGGHHHQEEKERDVK